MKKIKKILCMTLAFLLVVGSCFFAGVGTKAASTDGTTDTEVNVKTDKDWSGRSVLFMLSESDYTSSLKNLSVGNKMSEYNFLEMITITYSGNTFTLGEFAEAGSWTYVPVRSANAGSIGFKVPQSYGAVPTGMTITIPAGTVFPSYAYIGTTSTSGTSQTLGGYITTKSCIYTFNNTASETEYIWEKEEITAQSRDTDVNVKTDKVWSGRSVLFMLSESDYTASLKNLPVGSKMSEYNFLEKITITYGGNTFTLGEFAEAGSFTYVPVRSANAGSIGFKVPQSYGAVPNGLEITIPEGTVFPAYAYVGTASEPGTSLTADGYVTTEGYKYVFNNTLSEEQYIWERQSLQTAEPIEPVATQVTGVKTGHNAEIVTFALSDTDYLKTDGTPLGTTSIGATHTDYNYLQSIQLYTSDTEYVTLENALRNQKYYNMWGNANTISIELTKDVFDNVYKIVIPEGTTYPSYLHTNETQTDLGGFETTEEVIFVKPEVYTSKDETDPNNVKYIYDWVVYKVPVEYDTRISNVHVRYANGGKLLIFLETHDYPNTIRNTVIDKIAEYKILNSIVLYRGDEAKSLAEVWQGGEKYYNIWGEQGCVAFSLAEGWNGETITKVVVKEGCQFPSYEYTTENTTDKIVYEAKFETTFVASKQAEQNIYFERTEYIPPTIVDTTVTGAKLMGAEGDMRFILSLSVQDYDGADDSAIVSDKFKEYNTLSHIYLTSGSNVVTLEEIVNEEEVYYNLWGYENTISYGLKPEYTAKSFDKVIIQSGCEFPSFVYTSTDTDVRAAFLVSALQELEFSTDEFKIKYFDETGELLFEDTVICGEIFELYEIPLKEGYTGVWNGLSYSVMPAQDISYYLSYERIEDDEENITEQDEESSDNVEDKTSPATGDNVINILVTVYSFAISCIIILAFGIKRRVKIIRDDIGAE